MDHLVKILVGKLGAGKSAYAIQKILEALSMEMVVVTNIRLNWDAVCAALGKTKVPRENYQFFSSEDFEENPAKLLEILPATGALLVLDEVHLFLNARKWRENMAKGQTFLDFITQARKCQVDCILISQDERNVDAQLVRMATNIIRLLNWQHLPVLGQVLPFPLTVARICQPDGVTAIGREYVWRTSRVYKCYDTRQNFRGIELKGKAAGKVIGKRQRKLSYGTYLITAGLIGLAWDATNKWRAGKKEAAKAEKEAAEAEKKAARKKPDPEKPQALSATAESSSGSSPLLPPPVLPVKLGLKQRASVEADLPGFYKWNPVYITLMGGQRVTRGSFFVAGIVTGWRVEGGTLNLMIDSPEIPNLRLFNASGPRPYVYNHDGGVTRRPVGGVRGHAEKMAPGFGGVVGPGDGSGSGVVGPDRAVYAAPEPVFPGAPSQLVIPESNGPRMDWMGSQRQDKPVEPPRLKPQPSRYGPNLARAPQG